MHTLTMEQKQSLIAIIIDQLGPDVDFDDFADAMLGLFDDIPGFETISPRAATRLLNQLWSKYHG